jgi:hypothetical protein
MVIPVLESGHVKGAGLPAISKTVLEIRPGAEMIPKQASTKTRSGDIRTPDTTIVGEAIRQAVDEEKQRCIRVAWDILWWELEPLIGIDKVNEVGQKIQQAIRSHRLG